MKPRILIIDDDESISMLFREAFRIAGFEVEFLNFREGSNKKIAGHPSRRERETGLSFAGLNFVGYEWYRSFKRGA